MEDIDYYRDIKLFIGNKDILLKKNKNTYKKHRRVIKLALKDIKYFNDSIGEKEKQTENNDQKKELLSEIDKKQIKEFEMKLDLIFEAILFFWNDIPSIQRVYKYLLFMPRAIGCGDPSFIIQPFTAQQYIGL